MKLPTYTHINYMPLNAVLLSVCCWAGLYAVYANLGHRGFELLQSPGLFPNAQGLLFVGLHVTGLLLLLAFGLGAIVVLTRHGIRSDAQEHPSKLQRPL